MRRQLRGLSSSSIQNDVPDGIYLARVQRAQYRWHRVKSCYEVHFYVLQPKQFLGAAIVARLQCSPKALWKFAWFLRDFRYSQELLDRDEIDVHALVGLEGVLQVSREVVNGRAEVNLTAFAPAMDWEHLIAGSKSPEVA